MRNNRSYTLMLLLISFSLSSLGQNAGALFQTANSYYKNKQYEQAEHFYLQVLQKDGDNINANYNLGNTYYHLQKYPQAILYYEKAKKLQPENKDIDQNLFIANNKLFSKIEFSKEFFVAKYSKNFFNSKSADQWSKWMLSCLWAGAILLCIFFYKRNRSTLRMGVFLFLLSLVFAGLAWSRYRQERISQYAIILQDHALLQKDPVASSRIIDSIQEGTKLKLLDKDSAWYKVELPNGKTGWMDGQALRSI